MNDEIKTFIRENIEKNPADLALRLSKQKDWPTKFIADQINARQKAKTKLPEWYWIDDLIMPPPVSIEQASSQLTAGFKAHLMSGKVLIDLTGGSGVDAFHAAKAFDEVHFVERNEDLTELAKNNASILSIDHVQFHNQDADSFLAAYKNKADWIFIDPSRRDEKGDRVQSFEDSSPNVIELLNHMLQISDQIMIKASPMIDIKKSIAELKYVQRVLVVESDREVKEILFILGPQQNDDPLIQTYLLSYEKAAYKSFEFRYSIEKSSEAHYDELKYYFYEPSPSLMKAGPYKLISDHFEIDKIAPSTHLYTSNELIKDFPGRLFKIVEIIPMKELSKRFNKANIITRNYPQKPDQLKKKYRIRDGGEDYLIFTKDMHGSNVCLHAHRL